MDNWTYRDEHDDSRCTSFVRLVDTTIFALPLPTPLDPPWKMIHRDAVHASSMCKQCRTLHRLCHTSDLIDQHLEPFWAFSPCSQLGCSCLHSWHWRSSKCFAFLRRGKSQTNEVRQRWRGGNVMSSDDDRTVWNANRFPRSSLNF